MAFDDDSFSSSTPAAIRQAGPLIAGFVRSPHCPVEHRWHADSTLSVLVLFVDMCRPASADPGALPWEALQPDGLLSASLEIDPSEHGFLRDLLDVSASLYAYLEAEEIVRPEAAARIRRRLVTLALGLRAAA